MNKLNTDTYSLAMAFCRPLAALIVTLTTFFGFAFDADTVAVVLGGAASVILIFYSGYKNNDYTEAARLGTEMMRVAKAHAENRMGEEDTPAEEECEAEELEVE